MKKEKAIFITFLILFSTIISSCGFLTSASEIELDQNVKKPTKNNSVVTSTAIVIPKKEATLSFKNNAFDIEFAVQAGQEVEKGDLLVSSTNIKQRRVTAEAEAKLAGAQSFYDALIREEFREVRQSEKDAALEDIEAYEAELDLAESNLNATSIFAPFDGVIVETYINSFENCFAGQPVLLIADISTFKIETDDLDEEKVSSVKIGNPATLFFDAFADEAMQGVVQNIALKTTSGPGNDVTVELSPTQPITGLRWGMSVYVEIDTSTTIALPLDQGNEEESETEIYESSVSRRICDTAYFVSETIPDGSIYPPNRRLTKTWTFRNTGTCTWTTEYQLVFTGGERMSGPEVQFFEEYVAPNDLTVIELDFITPVKEGSYRGRWQLQNEQGDRIYDVWAEVVVSGDWP